MTRRVFRTTGIRLCLVILAIAGFTQLMSLPLRSLAAVAAHRAVPRMAQDKAYTHPSDTQRNSDKTNLEEPGKHMAPATGSLIEGVQQTDSDRKRPKLYLPEPGRESASASPQEAALPDLTIPLASGVPVSGTIGAASFGSCGLGGTQYTIAVPFGATQLRIDLSGSGAQDIDLFARFDVPIEILGGQLITDHASTSLSGSESITITPTSSPTLRQGTYFIGIGNCSPAIASFTLTATLSGGGFQVIPLISGVPVNGSLPAPNPGFCVLSGTQYTITVPSGATQLRIDLNGNQNVDLFARLGLPVDIQGGQVVADHASATASSAESITITHSSSPSLQQGTYFIGLGNCAPVAANFTLTATVSTGGGSQVIPLTSGVPVNSTITAPPPDACILGGTQYSILVPANGMHLRIDLSGNQDVDLFVRFGQPVEVQAGQAVADHSARTVFTVEEIEITPSSSPPLRQGTYFIAVANCGQALANLTITATVTAGPPPSMPNLTPFQPAGWSDKIVVSAVTGTHSDTGALRVTDTLFVDWAVRNNGTAATSARFFVKLFVDGAERGSWFVDPPLNSGAHASVEDFSIGSLAAGAHSIRITVDAQNNISEASEADNEYTKSITVSAQTCSTLTINIAPNDGGTVSSSSQATCQSPLSLAEQLTAVSSSVFQTPGAVSVSPSSPDNTPSQAFAELISKAETDGSVRVIVGLQEPFQTEGTLDGPHSVEIQHMRIALAQDQFLSGMPAFNEQSLKRFRTIPFLGLEVNAEGLRYLQSSPEVTSVEEDVAVPPSLAESVSVIGAPAAWASGFSGAGQTIAILDTGVDRNHPFLAGKVVSEACYSTTSGIVSTSVCPGGVARSTNMGSGVNCTAGGCEHGTHVAGIAAGRGTTFSGVARDANIIAIQVFSRFVNQSDCGGNPAPCVKSFTTDLVLGLERVQALAANFQIAAVNMSLGGGKFTSFCDSQQAALKMVIDSLRSRGIATVLSSGNEGFTDSLGAPACISTAISVGSTGDGSEGSTRDRVSGFSNSASFLNLLAPGEMINSSVPGSRFSSFLGTSMAAPHVAGAMAVLKSKFPSASVDQVLSALTTTGAPAFDFRNGIVKPRIQLDAALSALTGGVGPGEFAAGGLVTLTATPSGGFAFVNWQRDGAHFSTSPSINVTMNASFTMTAVFTRGPAIRSITPQTPKILIIDGVTFGQSPRVIINGVDRSAFIKTRSASSISMKGKQKKLGLRTGENSIQVIGDGGAASNVFVLTL